MGCLVGWLVVYKKRALLLISFFIMWQIFTFSFDKRLLNIWNNQIGSDNSKNRN